MSATGHDVRQDAAGWGGHARLTCHSPGCQGATLVRQPFMDAKRWQREREAFLESSHPPERGIIPQED